jgi:hypothetical protein
VVGRPKQQGMRFAQRKFKEISSRNTLNLQVEKNHEHASEHAKTHHVPPGLA